MKELAAIVGESLAIQKLRDAVERVAPSGLPVLIQGPTGSGKELVAHALHALSGRRGRLVPFNICAIAESMFEDALFGHVRGAFTGAAHESAGFLREANQGTAFLDEISGLPLSQQAKLLRALESGEFRPVGARQDVRSDFRVVAATNDDLDHMVADGRFRRDLLHRIAAQTLDIPALADRIEDIPLLVDHFLVGTGARQPGVSAGAIRLLQGYAWPGNVRELKNVVQSCAMMGELTPDRLESTLASRKAARRVDDREAAQRRRLQEMLMRNGGSATAVASELGVDPSTVYRWMRTLGIASIRPSKPSRLSR